MREPIGGRFAVKFESLGTVEKPENDEVREAFDIGQSGFEFRQNLEIALGLMLGAEPLGDLTGFGVKSAHESNRLRREHDSRSSGAILRQVRHEASHHWWNGDSHRTE